MSARQDRNRCDRGIAIHAAEQLGLEGGAGGGVEQQGLAEEFAEETGVCFHNDE